MRGGGKREEKERKGKKSGLETGSGSYLAEVHQLLFVAKRRKKRKREKESVCVWDEEPELDLVRREWACSYSLSYDQRFYTSCDRLLLSKSLEVDPDSASSFLVIRLPANIAGKYSPAVCLMFLTPFSCWWLRAI